MVENPYAPPKHDVSASKPAPDLAARRRPSWPFIIAFGSLWALFFFGVISAAVVGTSRHFGEYVPVFVFVGYLTAVLVLMLWTKLRR